jgi:hypothetical protein
MQIAMFRRALAALGPERASSLDCETLLVDPAATLARLDNFFGLGLGADHIARTIGGDVMNRHAKNSTETFDMDARRARLNAAVDKIGGQVRDAVAWSFERCPGTALGAPLPHPLLTPEVCPS